MRVLLLLVAGSTWCRAASPDELFCPVGFCQRHRQLPPEFSGVAPHNFRECYNSAQGEVRGVTFWYSAAPDSAAFRQTLQATCHHTLACTPNGTMPSDAPTSCPEAAANCDEENGPELGNCPVAKCMAPAAGCRYKAQYRWTEDGCCPRMCFFVDKAGRQCRCNKAHGPQDGNCPLASCVAPPPGCKSETEYERTQDGCCPRLCLFVDEAGRVCGNARTASAGGPHSTVLSATALGAAWLLRI